MPQSSIRKFSILGMVLIVASAITAAIIPYDNFKDDSAGAYTDVLECSTGGVFDDPTCVEGVGDACDATLQSSTTIGSGTSTSNTTATAASGNTTV